MVSFKRYNARRYLLHSLVIYFLFNISNDKSQSNHIVSAFSTKNAHSYSPRKIEQGVHLQHDFSKIGELKVSISQENESDETVPERVSSSFDKVMQIKQKILSSALQREMFAEAIGTCLIVSIGCGTVSSALFHSAHVGLWQIASIWGLAVTLAISCTSSISGAHLNPAVSLAFALLRPNTFKWVKLLPYWAAQTFGAMTGGWINFLLFADSIAKFEASKGIIRGSIESIASASAFGEYWSVSSAMTAFVAEATGTAILSLAIFSLTNSKNKSIQEGSIPPMIGATVACLIYVIAPLTQAGFNPARDFGPRIVTAMMGWGMAISMKGWWVYVFGPIVGAVIGAVVSEKFLWQKPAYD